MQWEVLLVISLENNDYDRIKYVYQKEKSATCP